jgi:acyl-CoA thioester hydrolase
MHEKHHLFSKEFNIRWQDMDAYQHVNHTIYFVYMQECRIAWLQYHNVNMDGVGRAPIVSEISCKYLRPITFPQEITIDLYFTHRAGRRIYFYQEIKDKNNPSIIFATGAITVVWIDTASGRSISPPKEYDYILETLEFVNT